MSVIDTVKEAIGVEDDTPSYRCEDCGTEFDSEADLDSYWFGCPECESTDAERIEE
ncbi:zinc ribbon domain-containing protein [Halopenitus salinus]|jgi:Zn finger protein HypA/HybF involved in hydrogenase expression|uniref:Zinc ribbon domain-containing protein n=1 Tax=Halopenitus salinus TaxID=1198295 RepID=A0ABD5UWY2_9EURY